MRVCFRKKLVRSFCLLLVVVALCIGMCAVGSIDTSKPVKITINLSNTTVAYTSQGPYFKLYKVADVDSDGVYTLTADFAGSNAVVNGLKYASELKTLAGTLRTYTVRNSLNPVESGIAASDSKNISFPTGENTLTAGMYLVVGVSYTYGYYTYSVEPSIITLPSGSSYEITVSPKYERTWIYYPPQDEPEKKPEEDNPIKKDPIEDSPEKEGDVVEYIIEVEHKEETEEVEDAPPDKEEEPVITIEVPDSLPQTGQPWIFAAVALAVGLFLLAMGIVRYRKYRHD